MSYKLEFTLYCSKCDKDMIDDDDYDRDGFFATMSFKCSKCGNVVILGVSEE